MEILDGRRVRARIRQRLPGPRSSDQAAGAAAAPLPALGGDSVPLFKSGRGLVKLWCCTWVLAPIAVVEMGLLAQIVSAAASACHRRHRWVLRRSWRLHCIECVTCPQLSACRGLTGASFAARALNASAACIAAAEGRISSGGGALVTARTAPCAAKGEVGEEGRAGALRAAASASGGTQR